MNFLNNGKDVTKECINAFSKGTKYFTFGGFSKLLINHREEINNKTNEDEYINLLSQIYDNDLKNENLNSINSPSKKKRTHCFGYF